MPETTQTTKQLTSKQRKAAMLVAEDAMTNARIAEECGVSEPTIYYWKRDPEFARVVREKVQQLDEAVSQLRFAKRRERIRALNEQAEDYLTIIQERADWFAQNDADVPGGRTGRIVRQERVIGTGKAATKTVEYVIDKGLEAQFDAVLVHLAKERGEWSDGRRELTGPNGTPLLPIVEIEVVKQMSPPIDDDDDV